MIDLSATELMPAVQSSIGWAFLAVRATGAGNKSKAETARDLRDPDASVRMRATISIDLDATDQAAADRDTSAVQLQFQALRHRFPDAVLDVRRRKPRASRRPPAPTIVMMPYADD